MTFPELDVPDYRDELEPDTSFRPASGDALLTALLAQADTAAIGTALTQKVPHLVVIKAPSALWAKALAELVSKTYSGTVSRAVTELKKDRNASVTEELQRLLASGRHVVLVSQDPDTLLPKTVAGAVDIRLDLPAPNRRMIAVAIGQVCGTRLPAVKAADITRLDFDDFELALRDGSNASDCVRRLRQAAGAVTGSGAASGPSLSDLPLSQEVRLWSHDTLEQMRQVEAGTMRPAELVFPVLEGPPGTGKTLLASALARSAGWHFVSTSVGGWFANSDGHLGGVVKAATAFVDEVLAKDNSVGLIDEADALPDRAALGPKDRDWWTPVITQVLLQIDRVRRANRPVMLIGATNYYDRLDGALVRAGRLERRVSVLPPVGQVEVRKVFEHYLGNEIDPGTLNLAAGLAAGATPATIAGWCGTARSRARAEGRALTLADLIETIAPSTNRGPTETMAVALHEAGHVAVARHFGVKVRGVSTLQQGLSGGHTLTEMISRYPNRFEIEIMAMILLGGRAADHVLGKGGHTGAEADLNAAGRLVSNGIAIYGLYKSLAPRDSRKDGVHAQTDAILRRLMHQSLDVVRRDRHHIMRLAERLVLERVMTPEAIDAAWHDEGVAALSRASGSTNHD